jgi:tetratricopeptide (TPR) repeat protein
MPAAFPAVGLHLMHAMLLASQNRLDEADAALTRELKSAESKQIYARECEANTCYTRGAIALRRGNRGAAESAFTRALTIAPAHVAAAAILKGTVPAENAAQRTYHGRFMDRALAQAIVLERGGRHADAARVCREALVKAPPGSAGWWLPVEPMLNPLGRPDVWGEVLALLRSRAL